MSVKKTIGNFTYLTVAELFSYILLTILYIFVARTLGVNAYGQLSFSIALITFFNIFADFGLTTFGIREIAKAKERTASLGATILAIQILLSLFLLAILAITLLLLPVAENIKVITFVYGIGMFVQSFDMSYIFQAHETMKFASISRLVARVAYLVVGFILILFLRNIIAIPIASVLGAFIGSLLTYRFLQTKLAFRLGKVEKKLVKEIAYQGIPFVLAGFFSGIYHSIDSLFIQFIEGSLAVGYYGAAYRILDILIVFTSLITKVFFPALSRAKQESKEAFVKQSMKFAQIAGIVAIPLTAGGMFYAEDILRLTYGAHYLDGSPALRVLIVLVSLITFNMLVAAIIIAAGKQKQNMISVAIGAGINIVLNFILIPKWGIVGASCATVSSEAVVCIYLLAVYQRESGLSVSLLKEFLIKPITGALLFVFVLSLFHIESVLIAIPIAAIVYGFSLFFMKAIPVELIPARIRNIFG